MIISILSGLQRKRNSPLPQKFGTRPIPKVILSISQKQLMPWPMDYMWLIIIETFEIFGKQFIKNKLIICHVYFYLMLRKHDTILSDIYWQLSVRLFYSALNTIYSNIWISPIFLSFWMTLLWRKKLSKIQFYLHFINFN